MNKNKGSHVLWKRMKFEALLLIVLSEVTIIKSEYGPSMLSLLRPSSMSPSDDAAARRYNNRPGELDLKNYPNYATVLPLAEGRSWINSNEILQILGGDSPSEGFKPFKVTPPEGYGIMATIQELYIPAFNTFNSSLLIIDDNGQILECFSKFWFQIEGKSPVQVCGRTTDHQFRSNVIDGVGPRSFVVPVGKSIEVGFVYRDGEIDQNPMLSNKVPFYDRDYKFRASIVFTAYKDCPYGPPFLNDDNGKLWPCDIPSKRNQPVGACISEELFCDGVINCGMHDSKTFAMDERFCKEKFFSSYNHIAPLNSSSSSFFTSHRVRKILLDKVRLQEVIRNRSINNNRPYNYDEMIFPMGAHTGSTPQQYSSEPVEKSDALSHPAFVALIILITIISVLIVGLIFRYCCKPCVGKNEPFGESSNPEAVARFHENLRNRDTDVSGQSGRPYGISFDSLFKPVDDSPPSYDDLFPHDNNVPTTTSISNYHNKSYSISLATASPVTSSTNLDESTSSEYPPPPTLSSVYVIPNISPQDTSRSINASSSFTNGNNESYVASPTTIHATDDEVLPGSSLNDIPSPGKIDDPFITVISSDEDRCSSISMQQRSTIAAPQNHHEHAHRVDVIRTYIL